MASITFDDGSVLNLGTEEELTAYLKLTGKYVAPKTQAQQMAEQITAASVGISGTAPSESSESAVTPVSDHPTPLTAMPLSTSCVRKITIPVSQSEYEVVKILQNYADGISSADIATLIDTHRARVSGFCSKMFNDGRHVLRGPHSTWRLSPQGMHADYKIVSYPQQEWTRMKGAGER
jgi:hypothetical protein